MLKTSSLEHGLEFILAVVHHLLGIKAYSIHAGPEGSQPVAGGKQPPAGPGSPKPLPVTTILLVGTLISILYYGCPAASAPGGAPSPPVAQAPNCAEQYSYHLEGHIGETYLIRMDFTRTGGDLKGTYHYKEWYPQNGTQVPITGTIKGNEVTIHVNFPKENMIEVFHGVLTPNCGIEGTWESKTLKKHHSFVLKPVAFAMSS